MKSPREIARDRMGLALCIVAMVIVVWMFCGCAKPQVPTTLRPNQKIAVVLPEEYGEGDAVAECQSYKDGYIFWRHLGEESMGVNIQKDHSRTPVMGEIRATAFEIWDGHQWQEIKQ